MGTLSSNNDVDGAGLGQSYDAKTIEACEAKCANNNQCVAFMYEDRTYLCELANTRTPNSSWGSNFRFCARDEENSNSGMFHFF